jgi:hypothetical protein
MTGPLPPEHSNGARPGNGSDPSSAGGGDGMASSLGSGEAPLPIADLSQACVRFVEAALGVKLDFAPETLPVLDHYVSTRRKELTDKPETMGLVARTVGAYFGEVVRRRIASFWHVPSDDPSTWEIRLMPVYLAFHPVGVAYDAITHGDQDGPTEYLRIEDEDREAIEARLAELPPATDEEFFLLSTRLEVLDIAVDAIKARMMGSGLGEVAFSDADYEDD